MICIVIDRCIECGDKIGRNNLIEGICEQCRQEYLYQSESLNNPDLGEGMNANQS